MSQTARYEQEGKEVEGQLSGVEHDELGMSCLLSFRQPTSAKGTNKSSE